MQTIYVVIYATLAIISATYIICQAIIGIARTIRGLHERIANKMRRSNVSRPDEQWDQGTSGDHYTSLDRQTGEFNGFA